MLTTNKKITLTGRSVIDNVEVCGFQAQIDSEKPENMTLTDWQIKKDFYKANRASCRADQAEFEDMAYALQDELIVALEQEVAEDEA